MLRARLRVFRAPDDRAACERYSRSHREVLEFFDLGGVTSSRVDWFTDPNVLVVLLEEVESAEALGGIRLERAGGGRPLPMERALSKIEPKVRGLSSAAVPGGAAELCALFSSRRLRGAGMGALLTRVGLALAFGSGVGRVFGICDARSLETNLRLGFGIEARWADQGTFRYPRPDLTAYVLSADLELRYGPDRPADGVIREFRESLVGVATRKTRDETLSIAWDLRCADGEGTNRDPKRSEVRNYS
ncbi:MAG TPA: hypothetical protein VGK73_21255 [Polyangiaceae bacterium]